MRIQEGANVPYENFLGVESYAVDASDVLNDATCVASGARYLYYSTPENRWKKCSAGTLTDLDTTDTGLFDTCSELSTILDPGSNGDQTSGFCGKVVLSEYPTLNYPIVTGGLFMIQEPGIHPSDCVSNLYDIYVDATGTWKKCMNGALTNLDTSGFATCAEFRALLPGNGTTGQCGAVVLSNYPTITQPTLLNEISTVANDLYGPQDCQVGIYTLYADASDGRWKKCENGVLTDAQNLTFGPGPTATAAATPTATAATPTPTGVTPTPTATASPPVRVLGALEVEGDVTLSPATSRTLQVGTCKVAPCTGFGLTVLGGNASGVPGQTGGAVTIQGGTGTVLNNGGAVTLAAGLGGGNASVTARLGFANTGGEVYFDGNLNSRVAAGGNAPTIGTCGTTPSIVGTNNALRATIGTGGTASACTITFADGGFANAPVCTANYDTAPDGVLRTQTSTTAVIITNYDDTIAGTWVAGAYPASAVLNVLCVGRE